jgi:hypothetical protein
VFYYACLLLPGLKWQDANVIVVGRDSLLLPHLPGFGHIMQVTVCFMSAGPSMALLLNSRD